MKWGGAVVSVLLVAVWIGSGWWNLRLSNPNGNEAGIDNGVVFASWGMMEYPDVPRGLLLRRSNAREWRWWGHFYWSESFGRVIGVPLWIPTSVLVLSAAVAWRLDALSRASGNNACPKCNYDRTGLPPQAVCPECGAAALVPPPAAS